MTENRSNSARRHYDSPIRRQKAAATRDRILDSANEVSRRTPVWDWGALTIRAVANDAGVSEATVYRYFANERELRDAVMRRHGEDAGIDLEGLTLEGVADVATRILRSASAYPLAPRTPRDQTVSAMNKREREALLGAVRPLTEGCSETERSIVGAVLDVLWTPSSYERIVTEWELSPDEAILGLIWAIKLVEGAIREGKVPVRDGGRRARPRRGKRESS